MSELGGAREGERVIEKRGDDRAVRMNTERKGDVWRTVEA